MAPSRTKQTARKSTGGRSARKLNVNRNDDREKVYDCHNNSACFGQNLVLSSYARSMSRLAMTFEPPAPTASTVAPTFADVHPLVAAFNTLENPPGPASYHFSPKTEYPNSPSPRTSTPLIPGRSTQTARKSTGGRKPSRPQESAHPSLFHPVRPTPGSSSSTAQPFNSTGAADPDTSYYDTSRRIRQTARKSTGGKRREH
ncbi:hypothetical protein EDD18DRAFT_1129195 [Armillaria luteobubalina]|uniref:Uncharacterized protein n=1 Tax=Armillaria luteobubalina TaxID=153913 RepID=A0AA39QPD8_9AGAR|nr:hypothetical protein EDD18DRAFT_1129195 [Armillaria luteobubalina]